MVNVAIIQILLKHLNEETKLIPIEILNEKRLKLQKYLVFF